MKIGARSMKTAAYLLFLSGVCYAGYWTGRLVTALLFAIAG